MRAIIAFAVVSALGGCANSDSIYRVLETEGKAVSVDAKQRAIISVSNPDKNNVVKKIVCAEPSPDALAAYGASLASTISKPGAAQAQIAAAFSEQAGSIGLRTQSIQLMRDAMYRACEGYLGGGLSEDDFYLLQRRYQNLTLGLLAIEQLTGAVKAQQIALSTGVGASTGQSTEAETKAVTKAEEEKIAAEDDLAKVQADQEKNKQALEKTRTDLQTATKSQTDTIKAQTDEKKLTQPELDALQQAVDKASQSQKEAQAAMDAQKLVVDSKQRVVDSRIRAVKAAQQNLEDAQARVRAFANGTAALGSNVDIRKDINKDIADSVKAIVQTVFLESGFNENCTRFMEKFTAEPAKYQDKSSTNLLNACVYQKSSEAAERLRRVDPTYKIQVNPPPAILQ